MEGRANEAVDCEARDMAQVGLLGAGTDDTAPSPGRVVSRLAAFVGVAVAALVGLGFATFMLGSSGPAVAETRPRGSMLSLDFRLLHDDMFLEFNLEKSMDYNIDAAFNHFVTSSGFNRDLSDDETAMYYTHFVSRMVSLTKGLEGAPDAEEWEGMLKNTTQDEKPMTTDAFVDHINSLDLGFTVVKRSGTEGATQSDMTARLGVVPPPGGIKTSPPKLMSSSSSTVPSSFDAFAQWPDCHDIIRRDHNQGTCGSCWAFAALSVLDSRLCIKTQGEFNGVRGHLSRTYATSCSYESYDGCQGGWPQQVFELAATHGIPTGGDEGCIPYFASGDGIDHFDTQESAPPCPGECKRASYPRSLHADKFTFGGPGTTYDGTQVRELQQALVTGGPWAAVVAVGNEFSSYDSGILNAGCELQPNHAVTAIGYGGDTCGGDPGSCGSFYWTLLNSWGDWWGNGGEIKVVACEVHSAMFPDEITSSDEIAFPLPMFPDGEGGGGGGGGGGGEAGPFKVVSGNCQIEEDCVVSPNFPGAYRSNDACTIEVEHGIKLGVMKFSTEDDYDYLTVNGNGYSGGEAEVVGGIESLVATGTITWSSDCSVEGEGWKICHGVEPVEEVSCGTVFDDLELTEGEEMHVTCPDGCVHHGDQAHSLSLFQENSECVPNSLGYEADLGTASSTQDCATKCLEQYGHNCTYFIFGIDDKAGNCWWESAAACESGFEQDSYNVWRIVEEQGVWGSSQGVWGSNHYTSDSNVCKSAAHFGKDGMAIQVKALGMKSEFEESTRNGISTEGWADKWNAVFIS